MPQSIEEIIETAIRAERLACIARPVTECYPHMARAAAQAIGAAGLCVVPKEGLDSMAGIIRADGEYLHRSPAPQDDGWSFRKPNKRLRPTP